MSNLILLPVGEVLAEARITIHPKAIKGVQILKVKLDDGKENQVQLGVAKRAR